MSPPGLVSDQSGTIAMNSKAYGLLAAADCQI